MDSGSIIKEVGICYFNIDFIKGRPGIRIVDSGAFSKTNFGRLMKK